MKSIFAFKMIVILCCVAATPAHARFYTWDNGERQNLDEIADKKSLFGPKNYQIYKNYLDTMDCNTASTMLNTAFIARYPDYADVKEPEKDRDGIMGPASARYKEWRFDFVYRKYPELGFCGDVLAFEYLDKRYRNHPAPIGFYIHRAQMDPRSNEWYGRDLAISKILDFVDRRHLPALIYTADLASQGIFFENSAEVEYFLLQRACAFNYRCAEVQGRIGLLEDELPARRQAELKRDARDLNKTMWANFPGYKKPAK
jgi:hypothetical protein